MSFHRDAYAEGADAFLAGRPESDNPYDDDTDDQLDWNDGWNSAAEEDEE